jgi:hypothetical protein
MRKVDLKRELKHLYQPSAKEVVQVEVPAFRFLMIDGEGDPNTSVRYAEAVQALFSVSYTAKFMVKKRTQVDYAVMPLEGLWWADDMSAFITNDRSKWRWTMMIMQPHFVAPQLIEESITEVRRKKALPAVGELRLETFTEGSCAQVLYVGPFSEEGPAIQRVHDFIAGRSALAGKHHEIYLSDVRRADPRKWRTVIRQPMDEAWRSGGDERDGVAPSAGVQLLIAVCTRGKWRITKSRYASQSTNQTEATTRSPIVKRTRLGVRNSRMHPSSHNRSPRREYVARWISSMRPPSEEP